MTEPHGRGPGIGEPTPHHETSDANVRAVIGFAIALVVVTVVLGSATWLLLRFYERSAGVRPPAAAGREQVMPATPRLQTDPRQDLRDLRAQEDTLLSSYGWADRNAGAVRIPIDQAMKLAVERGLPARNTPLAGGPTSSGDANSGRIVGKMTR